MAPFMPKNPCIHAKSKLPKSMGSIQVFQMLIGTEFDKATEISHLH